MTIFEITNGGEKKVLEEDFTWGVLAINLNKSSYDIGENVEIGVGVLDDEGRTICDADLTAIVTTPAGHKYTISHDKFSVSEECLDKSVTDIPDYLANYQPERLVLLILTLGKDGKG